MLMPNLFMQVATSTSKADLPILYYCGVGRHSYVSPLNILHVFLFFLARLLLKRLEMYIIWLINNISSFSAS